MTWDTVRQTTNARGLATGSKQVPAELLITFPMLEKKKEERKKEINCQRQHSDNNNNQLRQTTRESTSSSKLATNCN